MAWDFWFRITILSNTPKPDNCCSWVPPTFVKVFLFFLVTMVSCFVFTTSVAIFLSLFLMQFWFIEFSTKVAPSHWRVGLICLEISSTRSLSDRRSSQRLETLCAFESLNRVAVDSIFSLSFLFRIRETVDWLSPQASATCFRVTPISLSSLRKSSMIMLRKKFYRYVTSKFYMKDFIYARSKIQIKFSFGFSLCRHSRILFSTNLWKETLKPIFLLNSGKTFLTSSARSG